MHDYVGSQLNNTVGLGGYYSTHLYTQRAVAIIEQFAQRQEAVKASTATEEEEDVWEAASPSLFLYLAYQSIHSPHAAPDSYQDRFYTTIPDPPDGVGQHRRVVAGMVAALDEGIGHVTSAIKVAGMEQRTTRVFMSDTGGTEPSFFSHLCLLHSGRGRRHPPESDLAPTHT